MRNLRIFAALALAFGSLLIAQPAQASWQTSSNVAISGDTMQFSYTWGYAQRDFTDVLLQVTVTNNITNTIGGGVTPDTYRIIVGSSVFQSSEIHGPRTYEYTITGTQTVRLEGIDHGFWGGYYGPIMSVVVSSAPTQSPTVSPEVSQSPTVSDSASVSESPSTLSPEPSPTNSSTVSPESTTSPTTSPTPESSSSEPATASDSTQSGSQQVTTSPEPTSSPESTASPTPIVWGYIVPEGNILSASAPAGTVFSGAIARYQAYDTDCGITVSDIVAAAFNGTTHSSISATNDVFGDPCPGWYKKLEVSFTYASASSSSTSPEPVQPTPAPEPQPTPTPEPVVQPQPTPEPVIRPEPTPEPTPQPTPDPEPEPEPTPTPEPTDPPTEPLEPNPEPNPEPEPVEPEPTPLPEPIEPEPTPTPDLLPEPTPEEPEIDPTPIPEPEPSPEPKPEPKTPEDLTSDTPIEDVLSVVEDINPTTLTEAQVEVLVNVAMQTFETASVGSPEYEAALDLLLVAAQADDIVLDEELAAIPLIGNVAGAAVEVFNALGNAGADMSPKVREQSEKVVIAAVIVGQVAMTATAAATSAAAAAARRP